MRSFKEVVVRMTNDKYFTVTYAPSEFWQIPFDEDSSFKTTSITDEAPEDFQKAVDQVLRNSPCE